MKSQPLTIGEYLADFPPKTRAVLKKVRDAIRKALPGAEEAISYGIPAFKLYGRVVIYFAGWKAHYSLYPVTAGMIAEIGDTTAPYKVNDKGTIRFPLDAPVPADLIGDIARFRAQEAAEAAMIVGSGNKRAAAKKSAAATRATARKTRAKKSGRKTIAKKR
jgi:uncharacterized protein YdhG (YjbR/CyaY superfamily)